MAQQTDKWQRETWIEVATWIQMQPIRVGLIFEVELWTVWAEPEFEWARRRFQSADGLPGHGMRWFVRHAHENCRTFWAQAVRYPRRVFPLTFTAVDEMEDAEEQARKVRQLMSAIRAAEGEFSKLYACIYESWMLITWMWHGKYCGSSARALAEVLDLPNCQQPDPRDKQDLFFQKKFLMWKDDVRKFCFEEHKWNENPGLISEIVSMTRHSERECNDDRMKELYPKYDLFLSRAVDVIAITDCICELAFSHSKATKRHNM